MISQVLQNARDYEERMEGGIASEDRPAFHLSPRVGWMNDPNGFSFYGGKYHLFYQYHPYNTFWGPMHWGHAVSTDLLHWEYLPAVLGPDEWYDKAGCFSGTSLTRADGSQLLMYTGVRTEIQPDGRTLRYQTQCIAVGNGTEYVKSLENPVISGDDLPGEECSRHDFRDPKIWLGEDGLYYCVVANCTLKNRDGQILLYSSADALHWTFEKVLVKNHGRFGRMWECPDFFGLNGKYVLLTSPQDMLAKGYEYHSGNGTLCLIGSYDPAEKTFTEEKDQAVDYGIDFYAPQTLLTPDGRRVMIGWLQNWDTCKLRTYSKKWYGQLTLPRELWIENGRLHQRPIREFDMLRCNKIVYRDVPVDGLVRLAGIEGRRIDLEIEIAPADAEKIYQKFIIRLAENEEYHTDVSFRTRESVLKVNREFSGTRRATVHQRSCQIFPDEGTLKLRIVLDRMSMELFVGNGESVMSTVIDTVPEAKGVSFFADGKALMNVTKYDIR